MFESILLANIFATVFMTGVIWFVQVVQYPAFNHLSQANFRSYHAFHVSRTGLVVIPPMIIELGTSIWLTTGFDQLWILNTAGLGLVICIWISTFAVQLPIHSSLRAGTMSNISKLVGTNWVRTILWSIKAGLSLYLLIIYS